MRYPVWRPAVGFSDGGGGALAAEDPLVGPLRESDFQPRRGASRSTPVDWRPSRCSLRSRRASMCTGSSSRPRASAEEWLGRFNQDPAVLELVARVPRLTTRAEVTIEVA